VLSVTVDCVEVTEHIYQRISVRIREESPLKELSVKLVSRESQGPHRKHCVVIRSRHLSIFLPSAMKSRVNTYRNRICLSAL
jgi:hypothetical protein